MMITVTLGKLFYVEVQLVLVRYFSILFHDDYGCAWKVASHKRAAHSCSVISQCLFLPVPTTGFNQEDLQ